MKKKKRRSRFTSDRQLGEKGGIELDKDVDERVLTNTGGGREGRGRRDL